MKYSFVKSFLNNLPVNSEILGSPKGIYSNTLDWINTARNKKGFGGSSYTSIYPKHTVFRNRLPKTIDGKMPLEFQKELQHELPETFVANIPKGRAWSDCAVISPDDKLLADVSVYSKTIEHPIWRKLKLRPSTYIDGKVCILTVLSGDHNYFHWMFEVLPRLHLVKQSGINIQDIDYFFINESRYSFHVETLAALGISLEKTIEHNKKSHIKAKEMILPSLAGDTPSMAPWVCDFLRDKFLTQNFASRGNSKRIYINRTDARYRKIFNETQIIDFLCTLGFESLTLTSMFVAEQVELFCSADVIVAPHGAGLANIVFCKPETKIIEMFTPKHINPCYWFLSNCMSLDYYCIFGEMAQEIETEESQNYQKSCYTSIEKLSKILEIACIK